MKRAVMMLGLAALGAVLAGCEDPCAGTFAHNGKHGVLNFQELGDPAAGLQTQVTMLRGTRGLFEGPFFLTRDPATCFTFDDADIQVTLPPAFQGEPVNVVRLPGESVQLELRCVAPVDQPQEMTVRVLADGKVRYEDALDITCHSLDNVTTQVVSSPTGLSRPLLGGGYAVGGLVHVQFGLSNLRNDVLTGFGAVSADGLLASTSLRDLPEQIETFRAAAPGQNPVLHVGRFDATVAATLVDGWQLKVETEPGLTALFNAWPVTPDGTKLDGMEECRWTASTVNHVEVLTEPGCVLLQSKILQSTGQPITEMCVTSLGQTTCLPFPD